MKAPIPFLWFEKEAEEAANFYVSLLPNSGVTRVRAITIGLPAVDPTTMFCSAPSTTFNEYVGMGTSTGSVTSIERSQAPSNAAAARSGAKNIENCE